MSLIETYQSCKSLFAEKLITKGVNAEGSDGLTTLINKIDDIQQFGNGLFVWADKPILQNGETSNLYGLVLEDGAPVVGEEVQFYTSALFGFDGLVFENSFGRTAPIYTQTPEKLTVTSTSSQGMTALTGMQFDGDYTIEFKCKGDSVMEGMRFSIQSVNATDIDEYLIGVNYEVDSIIFDYGNSGIDTISAQDPADSNEHTVKFEITGNTAKLYFDGNLKTTVNDLTWLHDPLQLTFDTDGALTLEVYDFMITDLGYDYTDSKGLATVGYSGKGSGVLNIKAECMFVSKTYILYDCLKYENDSLPISNTIFSKGNGSSNASFTRESGYSNFSEIETGTDIVLYTSITHQNIVEFDVQLIGTDYAQVFCALGQSANASTRASVWYPNNIRDGDWHHVKIMFNNGTGTVAFDDGTPTALTVSSYDSTGNMYFRFITSNAITGINFKNWKCYPI